MKRNSLIEFKIGRIPKLTAEHNKQSWLKIERELARAGHATFSQLVDLCTEHQHSIGGRGFVNYCIKNQWLVAADQALAPIIYQKPNKPKLQ